MILKQTAKTNWKYTVQKTEIERSIKLKKRKLDGENWKVADTKTGRAKILKLDDNLRCKWPVTKNIFVLKRMIVRNLNWTVLSSCFQLSSFNSRPSSLCTKWTWWSCKPISSSVWPRGQIRNMFFSSGQGSGQMVKFNPGWNDLNDLFSTFSSDIMIYSMIWRYQKLKKLKRASKKSSVLHKRWSVRPAQIIFNHHSLSWTLKVNFINTLYNTWQ